MAKYKLFSDEQLQLANSINLEDYLRDQGETLLKSGSEFRWERYSNVTIRGNKWHKWKTQEGGYPINFLREFYNYSYKEAVEALLSYAGSNGHTVEVKRMEKQEPKEFILPQKNETMRRVYGYLLNTRYIDKEVINEFVKEGLIYEDAQYHNVVFVGLDEEGVAGHAHKKSTYTSADGRSYRGNVEGSDPRYSFHYLGKSNRLYIFEAPIDVLSYISLKKDNWQQHSYLSLCGLGMQSIEHLTKQNPSLNDFIIGTDCDIAGYEGRERISDYIEENELGVISYIVSDFKDFNEKLKYVNGKEAIEAVQHPNYKLLDETIVGLKDVLAVSVLDVQHSDLTRSFANMYYNLNKEGKNDIQQLKKEFITITNNALGLAHKYSDTKYPFDAESHTFDELQDHYRAYKDKGNFNKRIERIKEAFRGVKELQDQQLAGKALGQAYQSVANESMTMIMECERKIQQEMKMENTHAPKVKLEDPSVVTKNIKPKVEVMSAEGNIFNLIGLATKTLEATGLQDNAKDMFERITTQAQNNNDALKIILDYVEPIEQINIVEESMNMYMRGM